MPEPAGARSARSSRALRRRRRWLPTAGAVALLFAFLVSTAFAAHLALTLGSTSNPALGERLVVNAQGRTLYTLSPETSRHLLCKTSECLRFWPPVTVGSSKTKLKDGPGTHGRLGIMRRSNGTLQVTLRGLPLYRYSKDHAKGDANGEGIESFGGTWHAMSAASGESAHKPAMTNTPPMTPAPSYPPSQPTQPATPATTPTTTTPTTTPTTSTPPPYPYPTY
jgi:predicted lipoprotein with Yx(FWY)xxD motif